MLPERDRVRVHVARRRLGGEVGRKRFGVGDEWMGSLSIARFGGVDGGQAWEYVVQDFKDIGRSASGGINHYGDVSAWKLGGGAERWGQGDHWMI